MQENQARKQNGEELLPTEDPVQFKPLEPPSLVPSYLLQQQVRCLGLRALPTAALLHRACDGGSTAVSAEPSEATRCVAQKKRHDALPKSDTMRCTKGARACIKTGWHGVQVANTCGATNSAASELLHKLQVADCLRM